MCVARRGGMFEANPGTQFPSGRPHVATEVTRPSSSVQRIVRVFLLDRVPRAAMTSFRSACHAPPGAPLRARLSPLWRALRGALVVLLGVALSFAPSPLAAHEVPKRVTVRTFVRHEGRIVRILVRAPLEAMRDVEFPLRGAYLDLARADSALHDAAKLWVADGIRLSADGTPLPTPRIAAVRASLPSDHAFEQYADALAHTTGLPLSPSTDIPAQQVMLDVLLEYPVASPDVRLSIAPQLAHLGVTTSTVLRYLPADGAERVYLYDGDPGVVPLEPNWWHAASRFTVMGGEHLLLGIDHLLFLLCLVIPVRRIGPLVGIVTAFTVAHSITLVASALGFAPDALWFPPLVEVLIAASIVYMAVENVVGARLERRWLVAFGFGLMHGFGFSFALRDSLQFAGGHLITALAAFNVGIELAQIAALLVAVPVLNWLVARGIPERAGAIVLSAFVAHTAWHWLAERFTTLRAYAFTWPTLDTAFAIAAIRLLMGMLIAGGAAWALSGVMTRLAQPKPKPRAGALLLLVGFGAACALAAGLSAGPLRAQSSVRSTMAGVYTAEQAIKGREVFAGSCSGCHTVASHSGPVFAARWMGRSLMEFFDYVSRLMPKSGPGTLTEDEYVWVTAYVLKLNGMPASSRELSAEPTLLKTIRIDSTAVGAGVRSERTTR